MPNGEKSTISKCRTILNEQLNRKLQTLLHALLFTALVAPRKRHINKF
jgi:predicted nucleic acid-binding Zn ribbon protein